MSFLLRPTFCVKTKIDKSIFVLTQKSGAGGRYYLYIDVSRSIWFGENWQVSFLTPNGRGKGGFGAKEGVSNKKAKTVHWSQVGG